MVLSISSMAVWNLRLASFVIAGEIGFELVQVFFKVRDVDVLRAHLRQFLFVFQ